MKKTKKSSRRGLEMLSSLVTKVIVLCLCMSLAMGTTVFASDDPSASGNGTSTSSDAGSADSSSDNSGSDNSGSDNSGSDGSSSSTDSSSDGSSSTDNSGSDNSGSSDGSSSADNTNSADGSSSADNTNSADGSSSADNTNSADSSNTGTDGNDNADTSNDNAASSNDNADTSNTGTGDTTDPAAEQQEGSDGQNQQDAVQEEAPVVEQPAAEPVQGENLPPIETTPEQLEKVDAAIRTYSLMQTSQSQTTEESASEPITNAEALQKAINAAKGTPVTIVIGKGFALDETITIPKDANITLVLDGKTLTGSVDTMFEVEGILNVYDNKADEIPADQNTGDQNGNSGSTTTETPSVPSSSGSNRGSSKVVVANDTPTTPPESKEGEDVADNSSSLTDAIKNWVEQKNTEPTEGQTPKEKDKADQQAKDQLLKDVGTITTEKAVSVVFNVVASGQLKLFGGFIKNTLAEKVTGVQVSNGGSFEMSGGVITGMTNSGVIVEGGDAAISGDAAIFDNSTIGNGGGIKVENGGTLEINGGLITGNEAKHIVTKQPYDPNKDRYNPENFNTDGEWKPSGKPGWLTEEEIVENNNKSGNGGGVYVDNSTLTMTGGQIHGNKGSSAKGDYIRDGRPAGEGGGVYVSGAKGKFDLSGGIISKNTAGAGGGIFIQTADPGKASKNGALFTMKGGEVSGNTALHGEGGGIYINSQFNDGRNNIISAGKIMDNKTLSTNDGIGGGGIYVNSDASLKILNAIVTENKSGGLGAGLAACVHGKTIVNVIQGAAIFGNNASVSAEGEVLDKPNTGEGHVKIFVDEKGEKHLYWNGWLIDGHNQWANNPEFIQSAQDIFTASSANDKNDTGIPGIIIGSVMLGGGDAGWDGWRGLYTAQEGATAPTFRSILDENGNPIEHVNWNETALTHPKEPEWAWYEVSPDKKDIEEIWTWKRNADGTWVPVKLNSNAGVIYANRFLGLTSTADKDAIANAYKTAESVEGGYVLISGNYSYGHGAGIGNNGTLVFGEEGTFVDSKPTQTEVDLKKELEKAEQGALVDTEDRTLQDDEFTFEVKEVNDDGMEQVIASGKNKADGSVKIEFDKNYFTEAGEYTFTVSEPKGIDSTVEYDDAEYRIVVTVGEVDEPVTIGKKTFTIKTLKITDQKFFRVEVVDGVEKLVEVSKDQLVFTNKYTPTSTPTPDPDPTPTPDPDPTPTPDPDPDPTPTPDPDPTPTPTPDTPDGPNRRPTTPDNTDVDIPESPTPLAETPEIDIPDPEVPLADTPEIEIPDPDVPLADVPRTGDAPIVLFGAALFCICGLFLARLRKITK